MRRVLVIGPPGSGKSTFARALGAVTDLPVVHLDAEFWRPGWVMPSLDEWHDRVEQLAAGDTWIIEGNYDRTLPVRLAHADTLYWFERSRPRCLARVLRRVAQNYGRIRWDMAAGCPERIDLDFLRYIWNFPNVHGPRTAATVRAFGAHLTPVMIPSDAESSRILAALTSRSTNA